MPLSIFGRSKRKVAGRLLRISPKKAISREEFNRLILEGAKEANKISGVKEKMEFKSDFRKKLEAKYGVVK